VKGECDEAPAELVAGLAWSKWRNRRPYISPGKFTRRNNVRFITTKKALAAVAAGAIVIGAAGTAFAYWSTSGGGSSASGATAAANNAAGSITVAEGTAPSGLVPGGTAQDVPVTVTNHAPGSASVGTVTAAVTSPFSVVVGSHPACTAADFDVTGATPAVGVLAAGATSSSLAGIKIALKDGAGDQDSCKSVTVPLTFTAAAS
jgi:hypothetical protein